MDPRHAPDWSLIASYLHDDATVDERRLVEQWLVADPALAADVARLNAAKARARASRDMHQWDAEKAYHTILNAEPGHSTSYQLVRRPFDHTHRSTRWRPQSWAIGLVASLALVGAGIVGARRGTFDGITTASSRQEIEYRTAIGQRMRVTLTDGSRISLAPNTTLRVAQGFGATVRTVTLVGEAYFDVQPTTRAPFVVQTGSISTQVLGTAFAVRRSAGDATSHVTVVSGKVIVSAQTARRPSVTLSAGMAGDVTDSTATSMTTNGLSQYVDWNTSNLVFRRASTMDVLSALTRWYGYEFRLSDSTLAHRNLTVWLSTDSIGTALSTLKLALDVDLHVDDKVITLRPRQTTRSRPPLRKLQNLYVPLTTEVGR